jgi:hypothetical protein
VALVAVTVSREELPALMDAGLAAMATVGAGFGFTVMVVVCALFPPGPVAVAVYVVVFVGLTDCVPPVADNV